MPISSQSAIADSLDIRTSDDHYKMTLKFDVIDARIPFLLSRAALLKMNASLHFGPCQLIINGSDVVSLRESPTGHFVSILYTVI